MKKLRLLSLCSGIGGADLAAEWTGVIEIAGQVELDDFCIQVLEQHWPHVKRLRDIKDVRGDEFGSIDLMVGGIPCQPFSSAENQRGTDDDRYLWPEMFRIVQRCRPTWVVLENVAGFTYMALDLVQADLENQGYAVQAFVLPACAVGAPHIRARCFVVAHTDRLRESRQESTIASRQRGETFPASFCQRTDPACMADVSGVGSSSWGTQPKGQQRTSNVDGTGAEELADAEHGRCQRRSEHEEQSSATVLCRSSSARSEPQPGLGRVFDGISARLDGMRWPALPGEAQEAWEPARIVTGRQPSRNQRLKALGNAIVPAQIFPLFQGIVGWELRGGEVAGAD